MEQNHRAYNFSSGPSTLPLEVLITIQKEICNWRNTGASVMELSDRSTLFKDIVNDSELLLRKLLNIPENYHCLFLQGGARSQFAMVPMNLSKGFSYIAHIETGTWSKFAREEAELYNTVRTIASNTSSNHTLLPSKIPVNDARGSAYIFYVDNETSDGIEFNDIPYEGTIPLVCDMSSNLLTRSIDIPKFGLIFACCQKNLGISGITLVIIRNDLLKRDVFSYTPNMFRYQNHVTAHSLYNTASTFSWYVLNEVLKWCQKEGGLSVLEQRNAQKAKLLYDFLDSSDFYLNNIEKNSRSRVNIVFSLPTKELEMRFIRAAREHHLIGLHGHHLKGGIRASIYNAMPIAGVEILIEFMNKFQRKGHISKSLSRVAPKRLSSIG